MKEKDLNNVVIEIDEVELLITPEAADQIMRGEQYITLHRLVDNADITYPLDHIKKSIDKGITDRL